MNAEAQTAIIEALSQHQANLYRVSSQNSSEIIKQFNSISKRELLRLSELLEDLTETERKALQGINFSSKTEASKNIEEIKQALALWFSSISSELQPIFTQSAIALAVYEAKYTAELVGKKLKTDGKKIFNSVRKTPYAGGQLVDYLFEGVADHLRVKVENAIRQGISDGQTNQQIIQRIKGKKSLDYKDGLLDVEVREIERQVRTARNFVSNATYLESYKALGFTHVKFVSVLDGRSSFTCASLDQTIWEIGDPAIRIPPLHPNCRSILVGVNADGELSGERPFVMDERKVKDIPADEKKQLIGQMDANTSFKQFFDKTDNFFQRTWLGENRYKLYKDGGYTLDKFTDPLGRKYTLDELKIMDEKTFKNVLGEK